MAITSLIGMPVLGLAMSRIGERLGSVAGRGGAHNLLCAYLAGALLVGCSEAPSSACGGSTPRWLL